MAHDFGIKLEVREPVRRGRTSNYVAATKVAIAAMNFCKACCKVSEPYITAYTGNHIPEDITIVEALCDDCRPSQKESAKAYRF